MAAFSATAVNPDLAKAGSGSLASAVILFGKQLPLYFWIILVVLLLALALLTNEVAFGERKQSK
jgi:hypothetical protein